MATKIIVTVDFGSEENSKMIDAKQKADEVVWQDPRGRPLIPVIFPRHYGALRVYRSSQDPNPISLGVEAK